MAVCKPIPARRSSYRPELDGIRAFAVLAVMAFHAHPFYAGYHFVGGFVGVDVFFVLSGYLITALLLSEHQRTERISIGTFYLRRAFRLLPPLVLALGLAAPVAMAIGANGNATRSYGRSVVIALSYIGNWLDPENLGIIKHTWSLAIEEQYYLVWPFVLAILLPRFRRAAVGGLVACAALMAVARYVRISDGLFGEALVSTLTRPDGILIGSALALLLHRVPARVERFLSRPDVGVFAGTTLIGLPLMIGFDDALVFGQLGITAVNVATAVLIGHLTVAGRAGIRRVLSFGPLPTIGRWSYGLYLFHYPLMYLVHGSPRERVGLQWVGLWVAASFALASASSVSVERLSARVRDRVMDRRAQRVRRPLRLPRLPAYAPVFAATAVAATAIVLLIGNAPTVTRTPVP